MVLIEISGKSVEPSCPLSVHLGMGVSHRISAFQETNESKRENLGLFWSGICYDKCKIKSNNLLKKWVSKGLLPSHNDHTELRTEVFHWQAHGTTVISHPHTPLADYSWLAIGPGRPQVSFKIHQRIIERDGGARQIPLCLKPRNSHGTSRQLCLLLQGCVSGVCAALCRQRISWCGAKLASFYLFACLPHKNKNTGLSGKEDILLGVVHQNFQNSSTKYICHISQFISHCSSLNNSDNGFAYSFCERE